MTILKALLILILLAFPIVTNAEYLIPITTTHVYGNSACGGNPCVGGDVLIIEGGFRRPLEFDGFDGAGTYITVKNQAAPAARVTIPGDTTGSGFGILSVNGCKYLEILGNNNTSYDYGILVNNGALKRAASVWVYGESKHIKIGYLETSQNNTSYASGNGFFVRHDALSAAWTFDDFEIHHNYVHDARYAGMYFGSNTPRESDRPYTANFNVHHNLIKDLGNYGVTIKGSKEGHHSFHDNTIDTTRAFGFIDDPDGDAWSHKGMGYATFYGSTITADVYNNTFVNVAGPAYRQGYMSTSSPIVVEVYDNEIFDSGWLVFEVPKDVYKSAIAIVDDSALVEDNLIINSPIHGDEDGNGGDTPYGVYIKNDAGTLTANRNKIGGPTNGAFFEQNPGGSILIEGTGSDANIVHTYINDFGLCTWSDDGDYTNDDFKICDGNEQLAPPTDVKIN